MSKGKKRVAQITIVARFCCKPERPECHLRYSSWHDLPETAKALRGAGPTEER